MEGQGSLYLFFFPFCTKVVGVHQTERPTCDTSHDQVQMKCVFWWVQGKEGRAGHLGRCLCFSCCLRVERKKKKADDWSRVQEGHNKAHLSAEKREKRGLSRYSRRVLVSCRTRETGRECVFLSLKYRTALFMTTGYPRNVSLTNGGSIADAWPDC